MGRRTGGGCCRAALPPPRLCPCQEVSAGAVLQSPGNTPPPFVAGPLCFCLRFRHCVGVPVMAYHARCRAAAWRRRRGGAPTAERGVRSKTAGEGHNGREPGTGRPRRRFPPVAARLRRHPVSRAQSLARLCWSVGAQPPTHRLPGTTVAANDHHQPGSTTPTKAKPACPSRCQAGQERGVMGGVAGEGHWQVNVCMWHV